MNLTIFAATGGVGARLLDQALSAGHAVTAVVRDPAKLAAQTERTAQIARTERTGRDVRAGRDIRADGDVRPGRDIRVVTADLCAPDPAALRDAVAGADAVLSGFGPHGQADAGHTAAGTRAIAEAMTAAGVRRIVVVSAAPVSTTPSPGRPHPPRHDPGEGPVMRYVGARVAQRLFGKVYVDLAAMEDVLRDSGLDWTVVRPPRLTDKPLTGGYRTAVGRNLRNGASASRADVAHFMLRCLDDPATVHQAIGIAR
jgi:putative NADH-flavin reductase